MVGALVLRSAAEGSSLFVQCNILHGFFDDAQDKVQHDTDSIGTPWKQ
jgi:hypothetical protein